MCKRRSVYSLATRFASCSTLSSTADMNARGWT